MVKGERGKSKDKKAGNGNALRVVGQVTGYRNLRLAGGVRVEFDFFDAGDEELFRLVTLGNRREVVELEIRPHEGKDEDGEA